jgi:hypothetical protein
MSDLFIRRTAVVEDSCRYTLSRQWDEQLPMAAWLLCNPSTADDQADDPTCRRMARFSRELGCGGFTVVNVWPLRTPYPGDLWKMIAAGEATRPRMYANHLAIDVAQLRSEMLIVGFGPEPARRARGAVERALYFFTKGGVRPVLAFGATDDGWPLHPLARGKFAIPNSRRPVPWSIPQ